MATVILSPAETLMPAALLGLVFGSFVTAMSYRLPRGQSVAVGRSQCPHCKASLTARDLVPLMSWAINRGRCRRCGAPVSARYPAIELVTAGAFMSAAWRVQDPVELLLLLAAGTLMVALAVIDLEHRRLPHGLLGALGVALLALAWVRGVDLAVALGLGLAIAGGGLALAGATRAMLGAPALGAGDAYALALGAVALPWSMTIVFAGLAGALGLAFGLGWRAAKGERRFPFAPAVFTALWISLLYPGIYEGLMDRFVGEQMPAPAAQGAQNMNFSAVAWA
jgi:prepilin signal peptidase PulO-like enzyme (type II secretory pathway)